MLCFGAGLEFDLVKVMKLRGRIIPAFSYFELTSNMNRYTKSDDNTFKMIP